jgi:hypothetical protein
MMNVLGLFLLIAPAALVIGALLYLRSRGRF